MKKTPSTDKKAAEKARRWFLVDANNKVLGRLASEIASILRGKHKVTYTPHTDTGDFVVVINAATVRLTGSKETKKVYQHHTGYVGGLVERTAEKQRAHRAETLIEHAVKGMLPKGPLGRAMFSKLKVYAEGAHPHSAQQPAALSLAS